MPRFRTAATVRLAPRERVFPSDTDRKRGGGREEKKGTKQKGRRERGRERDGNRGREERGEKRATYPPPLPFLSLALLFSFSPGDEPSYFRAPDSSS